MEEETTPPPKAPVVKKITKDYQLSAKSKGAGPPPEPLAPPSGNPGGEASSHLGPSAGPFPGGFYPPFPDSGAGVPPLRAGTPEAAAVAALLEHLLQRTQAAGPMAPPPAPRDPGIVVINLVLC